MHKKISMTLASGTAGANARELNTDERINPVLIPACEVSDLAMSIHRNPEDFDEGDLLDRIREFSMYELKQLPLSELDLEEWMHNEELSDEYCEKLLQGEEAPPIIFDGVYSSIIDGIHRANGYSKAGRTSIPAYVGTSNSDSSSS